MNGVTLRGLGAAESFFDHHAMDHRSFLTGSQNIDLSHALTGSGSGASFGFRYDITSISSTVPAASIRSAIPEASTWMMMALGFAGLSFAGYRMRVHGAADRCGKNYPFARV